MLGRISHGELHEVRLLGDANLVLDRSALATSGVRLAFEPGPDFAEAVVVVQRGLGPRRALTAESLGRVPLPTRFLELPGAELFGPRRAFTAQAVRADGSGYALAAWFQGDVLRIGQRTGYVGR